MLSIPPSLQTKLDSGVTTLAHAWIVRRRDGGVQGFTDHDRDLVVSGVTCRAGTGFTASEATARFDLAVDGAEVSGVLAGDSLTDADLAAGRYDAARVESWLLDWSDPSLAVMTARAFLGEVKREGEAFTAELRGLGDLLSQESGRLYTEKMRSGPRRYALPRRSERPGAPWRRRGDADDGDGGVPRVRAGRVHGRAVHRGAAELDRRRECRSGDGDQIASRDRWHGADRAVAGDGRIDRAGRCVHADRGLRQAVCDLPTTA